MTHKSTRCPFCFSSNVQENPGYSYDCLEPLCGESWQNTQPLPAWYVSFVNELLVENNSNHEDFEADCLELTRAEKERYQ